MELGVFRMEVVLETVEVASSFPFAHGQVVEQVVAAGLWRGGWHFLLLEHPPEALDGQAAHVFYGVAARHDDVHACETSHGAYVNDVFLGFAVAEPCGHEVLYAVHGSRSDGRLLVGLRNAQVECGESLVYAGDVDAWLQVSVVDGETLNDFHNECFFCFCLQRYEIIIK